MTKALFIGAAVADRILKIAHPVQLAASNITHSTLRPGGVGANTARSFAQSGGQAQLLTMLGEDELGPWLAQTLKSANVALESLQTHTRYPTASYSAVHGPDGELVIGLAEMDIFEHISASGLQQIDQHLKACDTLFVDANLDAETISHIAKAKQNRFMAAAAVSPAKCIRLKPAASAIDFLFCNRREAAALTGLDNTDPCEAFLPGLRQLGFAAGIITDGAAPLCLFGEENNHEVITVPRLDVANVVNGAGDALAGGILFGLADGLTPKQAVTGSGFAAVTRHMKDIS